jgi:hypothetical protein
MTIKLAPPRLTYYVNHTGNCVLKEKWGLGKDTDGRWQTID